MPTDFEGRTAIVTGASRGLGLEIARGLLAGGARVTVTGRDAAALEKAAAGLGGETLAVPGDTSVEEDVKRTFEKTLERFDGPDVLVCNAGTALLSPVSATTREAWDALFAVHATGPFLMCREAVRIMRERKKPGSILIVSSVLGKSGSAMASAYSAAKAAALGFVRALAKEVAPLRINVNAVCPGAMDTDMFRKDTLGVMAEKMKADPEKLLGHTLSSIPLGRLLDASEVAELALFLCSEKARGITGQSYTISCGYDIH